MAETFQALLITGYVLKDNFADDYWHSLAVENLDALASNPLLSRFSETFSLTRSFKDMKPIRCDAAIFSGSVSVVAAKRIDGRKIWYCHTPPRILFDKKDYYLSEQRGVGKLALLVFQQLFKRQFMSAIRHMDCVIANSRTVQQRIAKYLGIESEVVYPPCDTDGFGWIEQGDYYLSTARVDELKRVEVVAEAFAAMPDKRLVVVSDGNRMPQVRSIAKGCPNIEILGWVAQERLQELVGRCIASIYIPRDEDFGISPVESMAAGKPVIGVDEGGVSETVIDGETGLLLRPSPTPEDVRRAVLKLEAGRALSMRDSCVDRSRRFTREAFVEGIRARL